MEVYISKIVEISYNQDDIVLASLYHHKLCLLLGSGHSSVGRAGPRPQGPRRCQDQVGLGLGQTRISERAISRMSHIRPLKVEWHLD